MSQSFYRRLITGVLLLVLAVVWWLRTDAPTITPSTSPEQTPITQSKAVDNQALINAFEHQQSKVQLLGHGQVLKTLPDDQQGSRHQRFILKLDKQHTILVAHNIDLAPRLPGLKKGDEVTFYGVYEYNPQGGVVHWTHHDPAGRHIDGWLEYKGQRYQ